MCGITPTIGKRKTNAFPAKARKTVGKHRKSQTPHVSGRRKKKEKMGRLGWRTSEKRMLTKEKGAPRGTFLRFSGQKACYVCREGKGKVFLTEGKGSDGQLTNIE